MEPVSHQPFDSLAVFPTLMRFHLEGTLCDVKVQVGDESFHCHRLLLAAISEFFETMFRSDFEERSSDNDEPVVLRGVHPLPFKEILNFMHTDQVNIHDKNVHLLLRANDFLQLRTTFIEERCFQFLSQEVKSGHLLSQALDVLSFAFLTKKLRFVDLMCDHILEHVHQFAKDDKFVELPFDIMNTLLSKFREPARDMIEGQGDALLNLILCWLNHSRATRCKYRNVLMQNINSSCISMDYALSLLNERENLMDKVADSGNGKAEWFANLYHPGLVPEVDGVECTTIGTTGRFKIMNFKSTWRTKVSQTFRIHDALWSVKIERSEMTQSLSFFVHFDSEHGARRARVSFMILSQKYGLKAFVKSNAVYTYVPGSSLGIRNFIKWVDITNEEKGYIKDNCVIFQIHVSLM